MCMIISMQNIFKETKYIKGFYLHDFYRSMNNSNSMFD